MRKQLIFPDEASASPSRDADWLDLERVTTVEVSSEDAAHPIESALLRGEAVPPGGWRAAGPGSQLVRLRFDSPQRLRRIRLRIDERTDERTQEFVLRWSSDGGKSFREIVRQQWTFSPRGATREIEDYRIDLAPVTVLELAITPDVSGGPSAASLAELRLA
jgi:hypothetical protein